MSESIYSELASETLDVLHEPWADNYEKWTEELEEKNVTDPSVPFLAAILSDDKTTNVKGDKWNDAGIYTICRGLNAYISDGLSGSKGLNDASLDALYNEYGPFILVICMSYTNVTRTITSLEKSDSELVEAFAALNVTGGDKSVGLGEDIASKLGKVMIRDCDAISCGLRKAEGEEHAGTTKMSPFCQDIFLRGQGNTLSFESSLQCRQDLCDRARALLKTDPDIGGAGVFISYLLQISISVFIGLYIISKIFKGTFDRHNLKFRPKHQHIQRTLSRSNVDAHPAFEKVLYLFTRVQAWFVLSLIISGSVRNYSNAISDVDNYLLVTVALAGISMMSFTLLTVHELLNRRSPTTRAISAFAFTTAAVFYVLFVNAKSDNFKKLLDTAWYCTSTEVGTTGEGNVLSTLKFLSQINGIPKGIFWIVLVFCSLVEFSVIAFQWFPKLDAAWRRQNVHLRRATYVFIGLAYIAILVLIFFMLTSYFKVTDFHEWGFGQLMAVTFWMPVIYDYISERFIDPEDNPLSSRVVESTVYLQPLTTGEKDDGETTATVVT